MFSLLKLKSLFLGAKLLGKYCNLSDHSINPDELLILIINCHNNSAHILDHRLLYSQIIRYMYTHICIIYKNVYLYIQKYI